MKKLEKTKANPLDQVNKRIEKYVELYDSPVIHDPMTNTFKTEKQMVHDENKRIVDTLNKYEDGADIPEQVIKYSPKKVPNHIKDKMIEQYLTRNKNQSYLGLNKQKPTATTAIRRTPKKPVAISKTPLNIDFKLDLPKDKPEPNILKNIEDDRNKTDPDFFKGLGMYLGKKF
jgi:predicted DNA-binding protein YlxM (UPF0122 family)